MANQARLTGFDVVTGAFSYSGAAIARELRACGRRVRTLTGHPGRAPRETPIEARRLDVGDPTGLAESLRGAQTLHNTYWVREPRPVPRSRRGHPLDSHRASDPGVS